MDTNHLPPPNAPSDAHAHAHADAGGGDLSTDPSVLEYLALQECGAVLVRELGPEDEELITSPPPLVRSNAVMKLRTTHHALARLLAEGASNVEASAITGYEPSTISALKSNPAFAELMAYYMANEECKTADYRERLRVLGLSAAEELQHRLNDPEQAARFSIRELRELMKDSLVVANPGGQMPTGPTPAFRIEFIGAKPQPQGPIVDLEVTEVAA